MNLCEKCKRSIWDATTLEGETSSRVALFSDGIAEADCEFWAHKAVNYTILEVSRAIKDLEYRFCQVFGSFSAFVSLSSLGTWKEAIF